MVERRVKPIKYFIAALIGIGASAGAFISPVLLIAPAFLGYVGAAWNVNCLVVALSSMAAVLLGLFGVSEPLFALLIVIPASVAITVGIRKENTPHRTTVVLASALMALGLYVYVCVPPLIAGQGAFYEMKHAFELYKQAATEVSQSMQLSQSQISSIENTITVMSTLSAELTIICIVAPAMLFGFFDYIIARAMSKAAGVPVRAMAEVFRWELSRSQSGGSLLLLLGALALSFTGIENMGAILVAVELIVFGPVILQGVCFIEFLARLRLKKANTFRALVYIASVLLVPYSFFAYIIIAFIDKVMRVRKRFFAQ